MANTFIIAEAGVNHNGDVTRAFELVDAAADADADAVKFQTFRAEDSITANAPKAAYQAERTGTGESQLDMARKLELNDQAFLDIQARCRQRNIEFLSSPFDLRSITFLADTMGVSTLKLPSGEITHGPYLLAAARSGCELILSTGMSTLDDVRAALGVIAFGLTKSRGRPGETAFRKAFESAEGQAALKEKISLLHCTTEYPAPFADINLRAMESLRAAFGLSVGLSDHSPGIAVPMAAVALRATIIEKHFTLDRSLPGPDHKASLDPNELKALVEGIRAVEMALGDGEKKTMPSETKNKAVARRSLVAAKAIRASEPFSEDNLCAKRPGTGVSPMAFWEFLDRPAKRDFAADDLIEDLAGRNGITTVSRNIGVVTSARSDFGLLSPFMRAIVREPALNLTVYATGMHFSRKHGFSIDEIMATELANVLVEVSCGELGDSAAAAASAIGRGVEEFARVFEKKTPDILVIMGDRIDVIPAALAALPFNLPVAHISGGELTEGVIDEQIRHSITKLSHLHFPAHETAARRIIQMGEESWRVAAVGEPGLDTLKDFTFQDQSAVFGKLGLDRDQRVTTFTYHPETLAPEHVKRDIEAVLAAAERTESQIVFTYPNNDTGSEIIIEAIETYAGGHDGCSCHASLGRDGYLNLLRYADCMVGNSSSGIVEAAWFELPVVNIGNRQQGRVMPRNVINVPAETKAVAGAWAKALEPDFRKGLSGLENPYGDGYAADRIVDRLKSVKLGNRLIVKRFQDPQGPEHAGVAIR